MVSARLSCHGTVSNATMVRQESIPVPVRQRMLTVRCIECAGVVKLAQRRVNHSLQVVKWLTKNRHSSNSNSRIVQDAIQEKLNLIIAARFNPTFTMTLIPCVIVVMHVVVAVPMTSEENTYERLKFGKCFKTFCTNTGTDKESCPIMVSVSAGKIQRPCNCCPNCRGTCGRSQQEGITFPISRVRTHWH